MLKIIKFLNSLGITADIPAIAKPEIGHKSLEDALKLSLKNEQTVTASIHKALTLAHKNSDYSVFDLLEWFATEQVHEETKLR